MKKALSVFLIVLLSGCVSLKQKDDAGSLRLMNTISLVNNTTKALNRSGSLDKLDKDFENIKRDLQSAMTFATFRQRKDYFRRKNISLLGVLFGLTATTLNAASAANIVTSTAFTGLQTATMGYISTDDNLVDPYSNHIVTSTKTELETLYKQYSKLRAELDNTNLQDAQWQTKYEEAYSVLESINFKCFSILPPQE